MTWTSRNACRLGALGQADRSEVRGLEDRDRLDAGALEGGDPGARERQEEPALRLEASRPRTTPPRTGRRSPRRFRGAASSPRRARATWSSTPTAARGRPSPRRSSSAAAPSAWTSTRTRSSSRPPRSSAAVPAGLALEPGGRVNARVGAQRILDRAARRLLQARLDGDAGSAPRPEKTTTRSITARMRSRRSSRVEDVPRVAARADRNRRRNRGL